jgi:phosphotransferase system HPr (HPr) family protein
MKLTEGLHARPAALLVRLAGRFAARISVIHLARGTRADAKSILAVLRLGARIGDEIEIEASGEGAEVARAALVQLVQRGFSEDLVPELGTPAVEGIAIGIAVVVTADGDAPSGSYTVDAVSQGMRAAKAVAEVTADLDALMRGLPKPEAALFAPEVTIVRELEHAILDRIEAGQTAVAAVRAETEEAPTDLFADARERLLSALGEGRSARLAAALAAETRPSVLVTDLLTPSIIASLPAHVVGVVASSDAATGTSHAAILARGRGLPLLVVDAHVLPTIRDGAEIVVDTTTSPAQLWPAPMSALLAEARARRDALAAARAEDRRRSVAPLKHLDVRVRANLSSLSDELPTGTDGVGLVRTELLFAASATRPTRAEQTAALVTLVERVLDCGEDAPVIVRLFDAGGDKPLSWLPAPQQTPDARGLELLFAHAEALEDQLRAIEAAAAQTQADVRVLLPLVGGVADVEAVRRRAGSLQVGSMIETPEAARDAAAIAAASDFVCIGTNDLTASTLGVGRVEVSMALDPRVLAHVAATIEAAHAAGREVTICGEIAADPRGARVMIGLGADALSVAPAKHPGVRNALRDVTLEECRATAQALLNPPRDANR